MHLQVEPDLYLLSLALHDVQFVDNIEQVLQVISQAEQTLFELSQTEVDGH